MATNIEIKRFNSSNNSWNTIYPKANWNNMDNKPSTFTPSSHTHTKSEISDFPSSMPASDVYAWAKASSKPSYNFSEINNRYESYLSWGGGPNKVGGFGPLDACLVPKLGANRVAGIDGSCITVEKSTNAGSTWTSLSTSDFSNGQRKALFTTTASLYLKTGSTNTVNDRLRITMDATSGRVYTSIAKIIMFITTNGSSGCKVLIETAYYGYPTTWHTVGTYDLSGWSGWNVINLALPGTGALGGSNSNEHNRFIRFTFSCTGVDNSYGGLIVYSIYMFGGVGWITPSTLAANGVPYSYDEAGNVTFPNALVGAYQFKEGGTLLSDKYQAKGDYLTSHQDISGKLDKSGGTLTGPLYINRDNYATKPSLLINKLGTAFGIGGYTGNNIRYGAISGNDWTTSEAFNHYFDGTIYENGTSLANKYLGINAVSNWALASTKPSYAWSEITGKPSVATLDTNGKVPSSQLPSYVDDVLEYTAKANFPSTGETGKIYVDTTTNLTYRWSGSAYVEISPSLALGTTSSTAFRGDYGNSAYAHAVTNKGSAFASGLYKITTNSEGHVTAATAVVKADITGLGIPGSDTNTWRPVAINGTTKIASNVADALNLKAGANITISYSTNGEVVIAASEDTNSWRKVQLNGTDKLGSGTGTNPLNIKAGSNMTITESNGTFTFAATDTNTWRPLGTGADQAAAGNHNHDSTYLKLNGGAGLSEGTSDITDNTEILTSYASNNGFADTNASGTIYRRDAIKMYNYIKGKLDSVYQAKGSYAASSHSHTFTGSAVTSGANSGTAVAAVTGYGSFSGGSGSLTGNTTASGGIPYVEASLSGTELTLTVKYLHHGHTAASLGTPSTSNCAPSGHTHSVTAAGSVS